MALRGSDFIVDRLVDHGITHAIGLCGHGNIGLLDALRERADEIATVSVHHEQASGHIADAFYRVAGRPAATFTSCGPGSANLPIALAAAYYDRSAFLAITGNVPTSQFGKGAFQETYGHGQAAFPEVVRPYVKASFQPTTPEMLVNYTDQALGRLSSGRPAPVQLDVPFDLFAHEDDVFRASSSKPLRFSQGRPDREAIRRILDALEESERPLLLVGPGFEARDEGLLLRLADALGCHIATSPDGKSSVAESNPICIGSLGRNGSAAANAAARQADVIVALNLHFDDRTSSAWLPGATFDFEATRLIHVHEDPDELGRAYAPFIGVTSSPRAFVEDLLADLPPRDRGGWFATVEGWQEEWRRGAILAQPEASDGVLHPLSVVDAIRRGVSSDTILLSDVGVHHNWLIQRWETRMPKTFLHSWGFGSMGFGVAGVIGALLARPDAPAVTVCGDGGFIMNAHVVATAVQAGLPAVWVVWDNHGFVSIRDLQLAFFGGHEHATSFARPQGDGFLRFDFAMLARSMGAEGVTVGSAEHLSSALEQAIESRRPTVIHVTVEREERPLGTGAWMLPPLDPVWPTVYPERAA